MVVNWTTNGTTTAFSHFHVQDYRACQNRCQQTATCAYFTFWNVTELCSLSGPQAYSTSSSTAAGAISGPRVCPKVKAGCTEMPGAGFPGATAQESALAWPSHRVPRKLECWPQNTTDGGHRAFLACARVTVLDDLKHGFPGKCQGLTEIPLVPQFESCETLCKKRPFCSGFQVGRRGGRDGPMSCWHGYARSGFDCYMNTETFTPWSAKLFSQGTVRVLANTSKVQIMGLRHSFEPYWFINVSDAIQACRNECYSNLLCQYWQYIQLSGCWVEDPVYPGSVPVPPTTAKVWKSNTHLSSWVLAGEYIQHVCDHPRGDWSSLTVTTTLYVSTVPPKELVHGSFCVIGLPYSQLRPSEVTHLNKLYAAEVSVAVGGPTAGVKDRNGKTASVDLSSYDSDEDDDDGVQVSFKVDVPDGKSKEFVLKKLQERPFLEGIKKGTMRVLGEKGNGITEVVASTRRAWTPFANRPAESNQGLPWFCWVFLGLMLIASVAAVAYACFSSQEDTEGESHRSSDKGSPSHSLCESDSEGFMAHGHFVREVEQSYGLRVQDAGKGHGKGHTAAPQQLALVPQLGEAAKKAVAKAQGAFHRAEDALVGLLPGHHRQDHPDARTMSAPFTAPQFVNRAPQPAALTKGQLLQYAHRPVP